VILRPVKVESRGADPAQVAAWSKLYQQAHERLLHRIEEFGIPELVSVTAQDCLIIYRFPVKPTAQFTEGGLEIPQVAQVAENPYSSGVLLFAAAEALDVLASHGVLPGDIVRWAYLAGDEEDTKRVNDAIEQARDAGHGPARVSKIAIQTRDQELAKKKLIRLKTPDIHESVDLKERLFGERPTMELVCEMGPKGAMHVIRPVIENLQ
jgi:hypothetical protein